MLLFLLFFFSFYYCTSLCVCVYVLLVKITFEFKKSCSRETRENLVDFSNNFCFDLVWIRVVHLFPMCICILNCGRQWYETLKLVRWKQRSQFSLLAHYFNSSYFLFLCFYSIRLSVVIWWSVPFSAIELIRLVQFMTYMCYKVHKFFFSCSVVQ